MYKQNLPSLENIGKAVLHKSKSTVIRHLNFLRDAGYVVDEGEYYILPKVETSYFIIPFDTLKYLLDTVRSNVIKAYIYLG